MSAKRGNTPTSEKDNTAVKTLGGLIHCQWDEHAPLTMCGYLPYFSEFMRSSGLFDRLVKNCPLKYKSNNAPKVADVIGAMLLSILSGHTRYSHATSLYGDAVSSHVLGIAKTVSHDSMCRAFKDTDELLLRKWLIDELIYCCEPLLSKKYILELTLQSKCFTAIRSAPRLGIIQKSQTVLHIVIILILSPACVLCLMQKSDQEMRQLDVILIIHYGIYSITVFSGMKKKSLSEKSSLKTEMRQESFFILKSQKILLNMIS